MILKSLINTFAIFRPVMIALSRLINSIFNSGKDFESEECLDQILRIQQTTKKISNLEIQNNRGLDR